MYNNKIHSFESLELGSKYSKLDFKILNNLKFSIFLFAVFMVLTASMFTITAFATHESENLKWQLVFISSESGCSNYQYQMMNKFHYLAGAYLNEYQIENEGYSPNCYPYTKYPQNYEKPSDLDLFVLVYDKNLGEEMLQSNDIGGFYKHFGFDRTTNHVIVFCDCPNFNFSDPAWILTHELSHFSLFYLGYEKEIIEDLVHQQDEVFDQCREDWTEECEKVIHKVQATDKGYFQTVMPIYHPALEGNLTSSDPVINPDDLAKASKILTQIWASGKPIENKDYVNLIQILGQGNNISKINGPVEFADHPIENVLTWEELLNGESKFDPDSILPYVPFKVKSEVEADEEIDEKLDKVPQWFRETASWWAEGNVSDGEFLQSVHYLKERGLIDSSFDVRFLSNE